MPLEKDEWIELPPGGRLYELPGRRGIGIDVNSGEMRLCEKGWAVAAFIPPAYTGTYLAAYETLPGAETLPFFAILQPGGIIINFMFRQCALKMIYARKVQALMNERIQEGVAMIFSCV